MRSPITRKPFLNLPNQTCVVFIGVPCLSPDVLFDRAIWITLPSGVTVIIWWDYACKKSSPRLFFYRLPHHQLSDRVNLFSPCRTGSRSCNCLPPNPFSLWLMSGSIWRGCSSSCHSSGLVSDLTICILLWRVPSMPSSDHSVLKLDANYSSQDLPVIIWLLNCTIAP